MPTILSATGSVTPGAVGWVGSVGPVGPLAPVGPLSPHQIVSTAAITPVQTRFHHLSIGHSFSCGLATWLAIASHLDLRALFLYLPAPHVLGDQPRERAACPHVHSQSTGRFAPPRHGYHVDHYREEYTPCYCYACA